MNRSVSRHGQTVRRSLPDASTLAFTLQRQADANRSHCEHILVRSECTGRIRRNGRSVYTGNPDANRSRTVRESGKIVSVQCTRPMSQLNKQAKHTTFYKFEEEIRFSEHWKLVAESSEFHLTLTRSHRVRVHFSNSKYAKKAEHFKWKAGKRDGAKKAWVYARKRYCWHLDSDSLFAKHRLFEFVVMIVATCHDCGCR